MAWREELELMVTQMPLGCSFCFLSVGLLSSPPPSHWVLLRFPGRMSALCLPEGDVCYRWHS